MADDDHQTGDYHHVQGLVRGLTVLCELNKQRAGTATAVELSQLTTLHRSTVKRLLETLRAAGFVNRLADGQNYRLTFRVQQLSDGFNDETGLCTVSRQLLTDLTEKVLWPSDLVTLEGNHMVIRYSTHAFSPLSFHPGAVGSRFPVLPTAAGWAYLAFCTDPERELVLSMLRADDGVQGEIARDARTVRKSIDATRARGYGINDGEWAREPRFGALAVPIRHAGRVQACLNIVFSKRAKNIKLAQRDYMDDLLATAKEIERRLSKYRKREEPADIHRP